VLYVGHKTAYPLTGIVRVQWDRLKINTGRHVRIILANITLFLVVWFIAQGIWDIITRLSAGSSPAGFGLIPFAALVFFGYRCIYPARMLLLSRHPYFLLSVDTTGYVGSRFINPDGESLEVLARRIIDAIDNPDADWQMQVNNYHVGDTINQTGPASIGKVEA
jgi:hypothetical protein